MDVSSTLHTILFIALIIAVIALIVFLVELVKTVKSAHKLVDDTQAKLQPTLDHVEAMSNELKPAVAKVDPLVERLQLTVDAANVELMRVDKILEDVGDVTDTASNTAKTIDSVTSMPQQLVQDATTRVRGIVAGSRSSDEARELAEAKAERDEEEAKENDPTEKAATHVKRSAADIVNHMVSNDKGETSETSTQKNPTPETAETAETDQAKTDADGKPVTSANGYFTYHETTQKKTPRHAHIATADDAQGAKSATKPAAGADVPSDAPTK